MCTGEAGRYTRDKEPGPCGVMGSGERVSLRAESWDWGR